VYEYDNIANIANIYSKHYLNWLKKANTIVSKYLFNLFFYKIIGHSLINNKMFGYDGFTLLLQAKYLFFFYTFAFSFKFCFQLV
jgi:hypothetical protein